MHSRHFKDSDYGIFPKQVNMAHTQFLLLVWYLFEMQEYDKHQPNQQRREAANNGAKWLQTPVESTSQLKGVDKGAQRVQATHRPAKDASSQS